MSSTRKPYLARLPPLVTRWIGYRPKPATPPSPPHRAVVCAWSFIGAFVGMSVLFAVFGHTQYFQARHVPPIIGSFAASAVLCYHAIAAPFSQPRALIGGHLLSSVIGVSIRKLFAMLPDERFEDLRWLSGSLSCAVSILIMDLTATTHPPAGATALLATTDDRIAEIGWLYIGIVVLSSLLVLAVALINNNMQRRYPVYWWTPTPPAPPAVLPVAGPPSVEAANSANPLVEKKANQRPPSSVGQGASQDSTRDASLADRV